MLVNRYHLNGIMKFIHIFLFIFLHFMSYKSHIPIRHCITHSICDNHISLSSEISSAEKSAIRYIVKQTKCKSCVIVENCLCSVNFLVFWTQKTDFFSFYVLFPARCLSSSLSRQYVDFPIISRHLSAFHRPIEFSMKHVGRFSVFAFQSEHHVSLSQHVRLQYISELKPRLSIASAMYQYHFKHLRVRITQTLHISANFFVEKKAVFFLFTLFVLYFICILVIIHFHHGSLKFFCETIIFNRRSRY